MIELIAMIWDWLKLHPLAALVIFLAVVLPVLYLADRTTAAKRQLGR